MLGERAAGEPFEELGVPGALDVDGVGHRGDLGEVLGAELEVGGAEVLLEAVQLARPGDRSDPRLLGQQPGERDLGGRGSVALGHVLEPVEQPLVGLPRVLGEPRDRGPDVALGERGRRVDSPGEEPFAQRAVGDEPDPQLRDGREDLLLGRTPPEGVLALESGDGMDRVRAPDGVGGRLGHPEVPHLAGLDQPLDGAGDVLDGDVRVDAVLVVEVDDVDVEPAQRALDRPVDVLRPARHAVRDAVVVVREAELRGDDHLVAVRREGLADDLLVDERPVDLRRVEERHPAGHGVADQRDRLGGVRQRSVALAHPHAAEAERGDLQSLSECSRSHVGSSRMR